MLHRISLLPNPDWACLDREDQRGKMAVVSPGENVSGDGRLPFVPGGAIITAPAEASDSWAQLHPAWSTVLLR
jgi:hypothetical protein